MDIDNEIETCVDMINSGVHVMHGLWAGFTLEPYKQLIDEIGYEQFRHLKGLQLMRESEDKSEISQFETKQDQILKYLLEHLTSLEYFEVILESKNLNIASYFMNFLMSNINTVRKVKIGYTDDVFFGSLVDPCSMYSKHAIFLLKTPKHTLLIEADDLKIKNKKLSQPETESNFTIINGFSLIECKNFKPVSNKDILKEHLDVLQSLTKSKVPSCYEESDITIVISHKYVNSYCVTYKFRGIHFILALILNLYF